MPMWSSNGRELFYRTEDQRIMVATYRIEAGTFKVVDKPRVWFGKQLANLGQATRPTWISPRMGSASSC